MTALRSHRVIVPVLLDDHAKNNWVWPLISDREAVQVQSPEDLDRVVGVVVRSLASGEMNSDATRHTRSRSRLVLVALALIVAAGALVWLLLRLV